MTNRLRWALALSVLLNLFLLGFGASRWMQRREMHGHHPRGDRGAFLKLVPPTPELRAQHRLLLDARRDVGQALRAEPYDAKALDSALTSLRATTAKSQDLLHARLLDQAGKLTAKQRAELANGRFLRGDEPGEQRGQ